MSEGAPSAVLRGYEAAATVARIASWEAVDNAVLLRPVRRFLPPAPADLAEIGAGTGRTAAWLAGEGYNVTAVEPVAALRDAGMTRHADRPIHWIDDSLPALSAMGERVFDGVLLIAVWQHLPFECRRAAVVRLAQMLKPGAVLLMSLRHGPGAPDRPVFACDPAETIAQAAQEGLTLLHREAAPSLQEANRLLGVVWTWLAFRSA